MQLLSTGNSETLNENGMQFNISHLNIGNWSQLLLQGVKVKLEL
jgi:hypothetical protein